VIRGAASHPATVAAAWPESAEEVFDGDQTVVLAHITPAQGVTLAPLTNFAVRDRARGVIAALNSSIGFWPRFQALGQRPQVAVVYHTRQHASTRRPEYVLAQGLAGAAPLSDQSWLPQHRQAWERKAGPRDVGIWEPWLRYYHWRVPIEIAVERTIIWPDLSCRGAPTVYGRPVPEPPAAQQPPRGGIEPRIRHRLETWLAGRLPHILLGWSGSDGLPVVVPVQIAGVAPEGIILSAQPGLVPSGGRRAGLLAHSFTEYGFGQLQRKYTGWLSTDGQRLLYAPHTVRGYWLPSWGYKLVAGAVTRRGYRQARRAGLLAP